MYQPTRLPFTLSRSNQCVAGMIESELHFEGFATYHHDEDTQMAFWEVEAVCIGFTQYQNGRAIANVENIKVKAQDVVKDWNQFETACIDRAETQYQFKIAA